MKNNLNKKVSILIIIFIFITNVLSSGSIVFADQSQDTGIYPANWSKEVNSTKDNLFGVAFGNNMFVAVGRDGTVRTSTDGVNWITRSTPTQATFFGIAFGSNKFVAVGSGGTIIVSNDGLTWLKKASGTSNDLNAVAWNGNKYIAVGEAGTIISSNDASTWKAVSSENSNGLFDITYNGSIFAAVGKNGTILTSADGNTWIQRASNRTAGIRSIAWNGSIFLALGGSNGCGDNGPKLISQDGITWTSVEWTYEWSFPHKVVSDGKIFVVAGCGSFFTSPDGINWTEHSPRLWLTDAIYGMAYGNNMFVAVGYYGIILTSPDGNTWTTRVEPGSYNCFNAIVNTGSKFVAVGTSGNIMTSEDGYTWEQTLEYGQGYEDIAFNGNKLVAVGPSRIVSSPDGITWTPTSDGSCSSVTWDGTRFIAFRGSKIVASGDGITWENISSIPSEFNVQDAVYNGSKYVAVGINYSMCGTMGIIMTSENGTDWTPITSPDGIMGGVAWNGSTFVAVGGKSASNSPKEFQTILTSTDGTTWVKRTSTSSHCLKSVIWDGTQFIAIGYGGVILASVDGINWTEMKSGTVHDLYGIALKDSQYIVVGDSGVRLHGIKSEMSAPFKDTDVEYRVIDGLFKNDYGLTSVDAIEVITIKDKLFLDNFKKLPDSIKSLVLNETIQEKWADVLGCKKVYVRVDYNGKTYAYIKTAYQADSNEIEFHYYEAGITDNQFKQLIHPVASPSPSPSPSITPSQAVSSGESGGAPIILPPAATVSPTATPTQTAANTPTVTIAPTPTSTPTAITKQIPVEVKPSTNNPESITLLAKEVINTKSLPDNNINTLKTMKETISKVTASDVKKTSEKLQDIKQHWGKEYIAKLSATKVINGFPDGSFKPDAQVTADQFITMVVKALGFSPEANKIDWSKPYIDLAKDFNLIGDNEFKNFKTNITREQMTAIIVRAITLNRKDIPAASNSIKIYDFDKIDGKYKQDIIYAYIMGISTGIGNNNFAPKLTATRAQASVLIVKMLENFK